MLQGSPRIYDQIVSGKREPVVVVRIGRPKGESTGERGAIAPPRG
jgi:hypothetical protein